MVGRTFNWRSLMNSRICADVIYILCRQGVAKHPLRRSYTVDFLKKINTNGHRFEVPFSLRNRLKQLGILRRFRGCRSGIAVKAKLANMNIQTIAHQRVTKNCQQHAYIQKRVVFSNLIAVNIENPASSYKQLNFGLWNARSLSGKTASACDFVISNKIDILAVTESWLSGNSAKDAHTITVLKETLNGFDFLNFPRLGRTGGGIAILYHSGLTLESNTRLEFQSMECSQLSFSSKGNRLRLIVIYKPPPTKKNRIPFSVFTKEFTSLLENCITYSGHLLISGDFNIHVDTVGDPEAIKFLDLLKAFNMHQHVTEATHRLGHTLDLIISRTDDHLISNIKYFPDIPSDHFALTCHLNTPRPNSCKKIIHFRQTKSIDTEMFTSDLTDAMPLDSSADLDIMVESYNQILSGLIDKHAPIKSRLITCRPHAPWFTEDLRKQKVVKRRLETKWKSTGLEIDKQIFKKQCHLYTNLLNSTKTDYYRNIVKNSTQSQLFKFVDKLSNVKSAQIFPFCDSSDELAEKFSSYFIKKTDHLLVTHHNGSSCVSDIGTKCCSSLTDFSLLSTDSLRSLIEKSPGKSCKLDPAPTWLLKICIDTILPFLRHLVNTSLSTGIFPESFKTAVVLPLLKKPTLDPELLSNYRPISNLTFLSKVLERVVSNQLRGYLNENSLFSKNQSGYRKHHSVETALVRVYNDLLLALDNKNEAIVVLLDLSSAFDTVNHNILLSRLSDRFGISGTILSWLRSYLTGRTQIITIRDSISSPSPITRGVPQGSVLGPLLFSLYISPIEDIITSYNLRSMFYADDSQIYLMFKRPERDHAVKTLENCTSGLKEWLQRNDLFLNVKKTEIIHMLSRNSNSDKVQSLSVGGSPVTTTHLARDLGVMLDDDVDLHSHISRVCQSSANSLRMIGNVRKYLDKKQTEILIHAFVTSKIDNCNALYYGLPYFLIDRLQRFQNTAARLVTLSKKRQHITPVLHSLHWLPVKQRVIFKILLLTFKALHNLSPVYIRELLQTYNPIRSLRSSNKNLLVIPQARTISYGERSFSVCAPKLWNSLPLELRKIESLDAFKTKLKTYLFKQYFNEV